MIPHTLEVGGRTRRLAGVRARPQSGPWLVAVAVAAALGLVLLAGYGGVQDGMAGIAIALVLMCGGAYFLQRLFHGRITAGFDDDGLYSPSGGWVPWPHVRHMEVRRVGNVVTGRRAVIWVAYQAGVATDDLLFACNTDDELDAVVDLADRQAAAGAGESGAAGASGVAAGAGESWAAAGAGESGGAGAGGRDDHPAPAGGAGVASGQAAGEAPPGDGDAGEDRWLQITPALGEARTLELFRVLERRWAAAVAARTQPPVEQPAS